MALRLPTGQLETYLCWSRYQPIGRRLSHCAIGASAHTRRSGQGLLLRPSRLPGLPPLGDITELTGKREHWFM